MHATPTDWTRSEIPELGLSIDLPSGWTPETTRLGHTSYFVLRAPDGEGILFVRAGPGEDIEVFVLGLGDQMTIVTVLTRTEVVIDGRPTRRVDLVADREAHDAYFKEPGSGPVHVPFEASRERLAVLQPALPPGSVPVLVGYRLPQERLAELAPLAERVIASVRFGEAGGAAPSP
jgi:hypothetical protein